MPYYEYLTSIPYLQRPDCWLNLHSAPELSSSFHPQEERSIILKLLFRLTDCHITPNKTCLLQIHPSTLRWLPLHKYFDTWPWEDRFLRLIDTISTLYWFRNILIHRLTWLWMTWLTWLLMAAHILRKFDCYPINHCDTFLVRHWLASFWRQF